MSLSKPVRGTGLNRTHLFARGLKACYLFNEATGLKVHDSGGNSGHGDMDEGDPSWDGGRFGSCIKFDGSDGIRLGTGPSYGSGASFTIVAWIRTSASTQQSIFMQRNGGYKGAIWFQINTNGHLYLMIFDVNSNDLQSTGDVAVNDGLWHQVACTYDNAGGQGRLLIDGIAGGNFGTYAGLNFDPCISCSIGFDDRDNNDYLNGLIDHMLLFRRALSDREIAGLCRQPFAMFESPVGPELMYAAQAAVPLAGSVNAQSIASATLKLSRRISGIVTAVSDATAILESIGVPPKARRDWLREALFNGMTANAFKLGTTLTMGWFWVRIAGCSALYRGLSMGQIDFSNVLTVAGQNACTISPPSYLPHNSNCTYFYLIRRLNNCGYQEHTLSAAVKVSIDESGQLCKPQPNKVFSSRAEQVNGNKIQLVWFYCPIEQESSPASFNIYYDAATGQIDYENPIATIVYRGRKFYRYQSDALDAGRYLFAIRAEDACGMRNDSLAQFSVQLDAANPDKIEILSAAAV